MNKIAEYSIADLKTLLGAMKVSFGRKNHEKKFYLDLIDDTLEKNGRKRKIINEQLLLIKKKKERQNKKKMNKLESLAKKYVKKAIVTPLKGRHSAVDVIKVVNLNDQLSDDAKNHDDVRFIVVASVIGGFVVSAGMLLTTLLHFSAFEEISFVMRGFLSDGNSSLYVTCFLAALLAILLIHSHFTFFERKAEKLVKKLEEEKQETIDLTVLQEKAKEMFEIGEDDFNKDMLVLVVEKLDKSNNFLRNRKQAYNWARCFFDRN